MTKPYWSVLNGRCIYHPENSTRKIPDTHNILDNKTDLICGLYFKKNAAQHPAKNCNALAGGKNFNNPTPEIFVKSTEYGISYLYTIKYNTALIPIKNARDLNICL